MPPHLHPRSAATSTLFGATLLASFVVVGIPHVFPCPRPKNGRFDGKELTNHDRQHDLKARTYLEEEIELFQQLELEAEEMQMKKRECPVPKPTTLLGKLFGTGKTTGPLEETRILGEKSGSKT